MKKIYWVVIFSLMLTSCAVKKFNAGYEGENGYKNEGGVSFLSPPESAKSLAEAELLVSQAQINKAIAEQIKKGSSQGVVPNNFIGVIHNINAKKTALIMNPFYGQTHLVPPGEHVIITGPTIPDNIFVLYTGNNNFETRKIYKKVHYFNSIKMD